MTTKHNWGDKPGQSISFNMTTRHHGGDKPGQSTSFKMTTRRHGGDQPEQLYHTDRCIGIGARNHISGIRLVVRLGN